MDDAKQVAQDAVRAAFGDEVADALSWALIAIKHRDVMRRALEAVDPDNEECLGRAGYDRDTHGFYRCGAQRHEAHVLTCEVATVLHELDAEWSRAEVDRAHAEALRDIAGQNANILMPAGWSLKWLTYCSPVATTGFTDPVLGVAAGPSKPLPNGQHFVEVRIQRRPPETPRPAPPGETKR